MLRGERLSNAAHAEGIDPRTARDQLGELGLLRRRPGGRVYRPVRGPGRDKAPRMLPALVKGEDNFRMLALTSGRDARMVGMWLEAAGMDARLPAVHVYDAMSGQTVALETERSAVAEAQRHPATQYLDWLVQGGGSGGLTGRVRG